MHVVAAPDKFRGTATAAEVVDRIRTTAIALGWTCTSIPLADGGEGTLDAFGGGNRCSAVTGPLGDPVEASWRFESGTAVIEMATASGLALVGGYACNDPMAATSRGTGELIREAVRAGARRIVVAVGGSACTDGGLGAIEVIEGMAPFSVDGNAHLVVAVDVWTTFDRAAEVYGPQKGATAEQVGQLKDRLDGVQQLYEHSYAVDLARLPGSGAASVPCAVIAGQVDAEVEVPARVVSLVDTHGYKRSWEETLTCIDDATRSVISLSV